MNSTYLNRDEVSRGAAKSEFYRLLLEDAGKSVPTSNLGRIRGRIGIFQHYAFIDDKRVVLSMQEKRTIVNAVAVQRGPTAARCACEEHTDRAGRLAVLEHGHRSLIARVSRFATNHVRRGQSAVQWQHEMTVYW